MRVLVFGNGWIGNLIKQRLPLISACMEVKVSSSNILDVVSVRKDLDCFCPNVVINTAGHCGTPNIDACEIDENSKRITMDSNGYAPRVLYNTFKEWESTENRRDEYKHCCQPTFKFIHLSSGCLWNRPYNLIGVDENESPQVNSWYSHTKVVGEEGLRDTSAIILRIRMPIDWQPHSRNLINKLSNYSKVIDTPNSVTSIDYLMECINFFLHTNKNQVSGIWNVCNGVLSAMEIMLYYKEYVNPNAKFDIISSRDLSNMGLVKTGRSNCVLSTKKIESVIGKDNISSEQMVKDIMIKYKQKLGENK